MITVVFSSSMVKVHRVGGQLPLSDLCPLSTLSRDGMPVSSRQTRSCGYPGDDKTGVKAGSVRVEFFRFLVQPLFPVGRASRWPMPSSAMH